MATLLELRRRVRSVKNMRQITRAMKLVAGAKLRRAQDSMIAARPYSDKMWDVLGEIAGNDEQQVEHPLLEVRPQERLQSAISLGSLRYEQTFSLQPEQGPPSRTRLGMKVQASNSIPIIGEIVDRFEVRRLASEHIDITLRSIQKWCENPP